MKTEYPAIEQQAKQEDAELAWGDESGLRSDAQAGRGYAPIGQTPEIQSSSQRVSVNYIASISNQGKVRFMLYTQKLTAQVLITFLERLMQGRERKLMWIVDRHPVHRADAVQQWLEEHRDQVELHFLPPYSPQLNPVEYLNCDVNSRGTLQAAYPQLGAVERAVAIAFIQTAKVTSSNREVFPASIHCLCCLNKCSTNYCRVNICE